MIDPQDLQTYKHQTTQKRAASQYRLDPVGYAREVLKVKYLWEAQERIAGALLKPPYKVLVKSGHKLGKSFCAAWLCNWWYDNHDPGGIITVAPRYEHLTNVLWKDIRLLRMAAGLSQDFIGPRAPEMRTGPDHYALGITATRGEAVTGRHEKHMLLIMDESTGIDPIYFTTMKTMFKADGTCGWLVLCNPVNTATQTYLEEASGEWTVIELSCMDHPNIEAERRGEPMPVPQAVTVGMIDGWVKDWCTPITEQERESTDIEWPVGSGELLRPGPEMEARCLGRWPTLGTYGVWSDSLWRAATELNGEPRIHEVPINDVPQIGCDVARFGDDNTAIHVRWGDTSLHHEWANGWKITQTCGRLIELSRHYADMVNSMRKAMNKGPVVRPEDIPIKIDDDGIGGGASDVMMERGHNVVMVRSGQASMFQSKYPNKRCEMWFSTAGRAREGKLALGQLDRETLFRLKSQAMAPEWELDSAGRRVVERKDVTKEKIGRSPDDMDAMNLAYYEGLNWETPVPIPREERQDELDERQEEQHWLQRRAERNRDDRGRRRLFGK